MDFESSLHKDSFLANALQASSIAHFVIDKNHSIIEWNRACEALTGCPSKQMIGTRNQWKAFFASQRPCLSDLMLEDASEDAIRNHFRGMMVKNRELLEGAYELEGFFGHVGKNGRWLRITAATMKNDSGEIAAVIETLEDITERKEAEKALRESEERFRVFMANSPASSWIVDEKGFYHYASPTYYHMFGIKQKDLTKVRIQDIYPPKIAAFYLRSNQRVFDTGKMVQVVSPGPRRDGSSGQFLVCKFPLPAARGIRLLGGIAVDITEHKQAEQEMERLNRELVRTNRQLKLLALRDQSTGLYNHRYLEEALEAEITRSRRYEQPLSLIMLDVDYFKSVNDVYGHQFGDLILEQLARQLKKLVRRYDIVGRYGGEEFIIISPGIDKFQTLILAQRILDSVGLHAFGDRKHEVKLKLSMAVVSFPEEKIAEPMDLVNLADAILDKAKEDGGNRVYSSHDILRSRRPRTSRIGKARAENVLSLKHKLGKVTKQANQSLVESIFAFAKTIEMKDHYTGEHVERTVQYATKIAQLLGYPPQMIEAVKQAAILHDLGKIGISDHILIKNSKLTEKEYDEIKKHPQIAADILRPIKFLHSVIPYIVYHHERWDGRGYPLGLKGDSIPAGARIISVADVFQALTSNRPYRKAFSKQEALKIIKEGAGTQFDPRIVKAFLKMLKGKK